MATIEMEVVNNSGELVTIYLTGVLEGNRLLQKQEIEALISASGGSDEKVKTDVSDPVTGYLADKIQGGTGIDVTLVPDVGGNKLSISYDGASIPVGTVANQILQWTGSTWTARGYFTMIPASVPKDPYLFYYDATNDNIAYTDAAEVTGNLVDDKLSVNGILHVWSGTQSEYNGLGAWSNDTIYFIE